MIFIEAVAVLVFFAFIAARVMAPHAQRLRGVIIDNLCARAHGFELESYILTHTKQCALLPYCAGSGYSIVAQGHLYHFTEKSSRKVVNFLRRSDSALDVSAKVRVMQDSSLELISLKNVTRDSL